MYALSEFCTVVSQDYTLHRAFSSRGLALITIVLTGNVLYLVLVHLCSRV
jgi:hypothetical protein